MSGETVSRYGRSDATTASRTGVDGFVNSGGENRKPVPLSSVSRSLSWPFVRAWARSRIRVMRASDSGHQCLGRAVHSPKVR
jgi:hypothetical protein